MGVAKPASPLLDRGHPLAQGLLRTYPVYEGSGLNLRDLSGNDATGTFTGSGLTWGKGPSGYALDFDGLADNYVALLATGALTSLSVAFWVYPRANGLAALVSLGGLDAAHAFNFFLTSGSTGITVFQNATAATLATTGTIGLNTWGHVALTWDGTTSRLYLNGIADVSSTVAFSQTATTKWSLGLNVDRLGSYRLNGILDGVLLSNRVLAAAEIAGLVADSWQMLRRRSWRLKVVAGGIANTQSLTGSLAATGALIRGVAKTLTGSGTSAGALANRTAKPLAGSGTGAGLLVRRAVLVLAGTLAATGALAKQVGKPLAGAVTGTGSLVRRAALALTGALTAAGSLVKRALLALVGLVTGSGGSVRPAAPPPLVADTINFAFTQADAVSFAFTQADTVNFAFTQADAVNF